MSELLDKIRRKWAKMRLQPIRVFCFHHVSDTFDESTMEKCDWLSTSDFKQRIDTLREQGYTFISLTEAHTKILTDIFRCHRYAVLTADDGWASLKNVLPWLNEQQIPITLFLNPAYLDGKHFREKETEKYLTEEDVKHLYEQYPLVTVGMHGWEHANAREQTEQEFKESVRKSQEYLGKMPNFIPYFAYAWGRRNAMTNRFLMENRITPLTVKGGVNYNDGTILDRELLY